MSDKRSVVFTGMHRSHTSLMNSTFKEAGLPFHDELVGANGSNPVNFVHAHPGRSLLISSEVLFADPEEVMRSTSDSFNLRLTTDLSGGVGLILPANMSLCSNLVKNVLTQYLSAQRRVQKACENFQALSTNLRCVVRRGDA